MKIKLNLRPQAVMAGLALVFCMSQGSAMAAEQIRIGYVTPAGGPHASAAKGFEEELNKLAPGRFKVSHFPAGSLGNERELAEALQLGSLEMAVIGSSVLGNFVPEMMVTELPFLFDTKEQARSTFDGKVGQHLLKGLASDGQFFDVGVRNRRSCHVDIIVPKRLPA